MRDLNQRSLPEPEEITCLDTGLSNLSKFEISSHNTINLKSFKGITKIRKWKKKFFFCLFIIELKVKCVWVRCSVSGKRLPTNGISGL